MMRALRLGLILLLCLQCTGVRKPTAAGTDTFTIAFGSCNKTEVENRFWDDILRAEPDLWIWGGDNIYADTDNSSLMREMYRAQEAVPGYRAVRESIPVIGTWDDHDYGLNDGGAGFSAKSESQEAFLDFFGVSEDSPRRRQEGVYAAHEYEFGSYSVKVLVLDTRYFRSPLRPDPSGVKRYLPHTGDDGTVLGKEQWAWLERELASSDADFNILVSSIQVLSGEHGFESWQLFPHEAERLIDRIETSGARGVIILSGDRHISEFSKANEVLEPTGLVDFTSSGLTHAYRNFSGEPNPYRVGEVVSVESYGLVVLDGRNRQARLQMRGDNDQILQELTIEF